MLRSKKRRRKKYKSKIKNKTRNKRGGDKSLQRITSSMFFLRKYIAELKYNSHRHSITKSSQTKNALIKFMENGRANSKKIAKILKKSFGIHTPCLMAALANQERCIFKNLISSDDRGYVGEFKTIGLDKICSDDSLQKVISQWDKAWGTKNAGCGQTLMNSMLELSSKKNLRMVDYHEKAMKDPIYAKEYNKLMEAVAAVQKDEDEQKRLYGDDALLLEVKNVFNPKEYELTFGGRTKKNKRRKKKSKKHRITRKKK